MQAIPHAPQLVRLVKDVSHPFETMPSQSAQPAVHASTQRLAVHALPVAFGAVAGQALPQAPQFMLVASDVSQPVATDN